MPFRSWWLVTAVALFGASSALACSCREPQPHREVLPVDGTSDFPVDGVIRVFAHQFPYDVRQQLVRDYRLETVDGGVVELQQRSMNDLVELVPTLPLAPNTNYVLEQAKHFDARGSVMTDEAWARALEAPVDRGVRRAFVVVSRFKTGSGSTKRQPRTAPTIKRVSVARDNGMCGGQTVTLVLVASVPAEPNDIVQIEAEGIGVVLSKPASLLEVRRTRTLNLSDDMCSADTPRLDKAFGARFIAHLVGPAEVPQLQFGQRPALTAATNKPIAWFGELDATLAPEPSAPRLRVTKVIQLEVRDVAQPIEVAFDDLGVAWVSTDSTTPALSNGKQVIQLKTLLTKPQFVPIGRSFLLVGTAVPPAPTDGGRWDVEQRIELVNAKGSALSSLLLGRACSITSSSVLIGDGGVWVGWTESPDCSRTVDRHALVEVTAADAGLRLVNRQTDAERGAAISWMDPRFERVSQQTPEFNATPEVTEAFGGTVVAWLNRADGETTVYASFVDDTGNATPPQRVVESLGLTWVSFARGAREPTLVTRRGSERGIQLTTIGWTEPAVAIPHDD